MKRRQAILARLIQSVEILGPLADEFVFVGGSAVPLLVTDEAAPDARTTTDVDVVVHVLTRSEYRKVEERLQSVQFHLDIMDGVICRFKNGELILDVMPTDETILKFGNEWYKHAIVEPVSYPLLPDRSIKVINAPLFLCTKFSAYNDRGHEDEKDLEDIISLVDGRRELLDELTASSEDIKAYVSVSVTELLDAGLASRLDWFLPGDAAGAARLPLVLQRLRMMIALSSS
jgi:predicted nucleotidyltransferase